MLSLDEWTDDKIGLDAGYMTTTVAGLWPSLVTGLVLLNTAGRVIPDYKALTYNKVSKSSEHPLGYTLNFLTVVPC
jgi:hypothetical protein